MSLPKPLLGFVADDPKRIIVDNGMDPSLQDVEIAWQYAHELFDHWPGVRDTNQEIEAEIGAVPSDMSNVGLRVDVVS